MSKLIEQLSRPQAYPHETGDITSLQTHVSILMFAGAFVYKIKKFVDFGFLNFTTLESHRHYCEEEVRLNRRLSPDMYLGVVPVTQNEEGEISIEGVGQVVDYAVKMKRLPQDQMLAAKLDRGEIDQNTLDSLIDLLIDFHQGVPTGEGVDEHGRMEAVRHDVMGNFGVEADILDATLHAFLERQLETFMNTHKDLFDKRIEDGRIREGHGDLHAGNICLWDNQIMIYDCIEFSDQFRCQDVASEMAFLAMDLDYRQQRKWSQYVIHRYSQLTHDNDMLTLMPFYKTYRAMVRGKVAALRSQDSDISEDSRQASRLEAIRYYHLAVSYQLPPFMVLTCGLPATGKSYLCRQLSERLGGDILRTDVIRKQLAGVDVAEGKAGFKNGIYSKEFTDKTYQAVLEAARHTLQQGNSVYVDAGFFRREQRQQFSEFAREQGIPFVFVSLECPEDIIRERMVKRAHDTSEVSDADFDIYTKLKQKFEPPEELSQEQRLDHGEGDAIEGMVTELLKKLTDQYKAQ